jgi:hypothetical protein
LPPPIPPPNIPRPSRRLPELLKIPLASHTAPAHAEEAKVAAALPTKTDLPTKTICRDERVAGKKLFTGTPV